MANDLDSDETVFIVKKNNKIHTECPICKEKVNFGVELEHLNKVKQFPFAHIHLHGNPIHALIVYIDSSFSIRGVEGCDSIEVKKDSTTFQQILKKWSNPF